MDVLDSRLPAAIVRRDAAVAAVYADYLQAVLASRAVNVVMTWGLSDRYTWLSRRDPRRDGLPVRPLLLDRDLRRKPAYDAVARSFAAASVR
jgi:endo-1,4-beta-xylanase